MMEDKSNITTVNNKVHPDNYADASSKPQQENGKSDEVQKGESTNVDSGNGGKGITDSSQTLFTEYIYYVPFINIIYDILEGTTPDFDTIKTLIETNGVVSALIFSHNFCKGNGDITYL